MSFFSRSIFVQIGSSSSIRSRCVNAINPDGILVGSAGSLRRVLINFPEISPRASNDLTACVRIAASYRSNSGWRFLSAAVVSRVGSSVSRSCTRESAMRLEVSPSGAPRAARRSRMPSTLLAVPITVRKRAPNLTHSSGLVAVFPFATIRPCSPPRTVPSSAAASISSAERNICMVSCEICDSVFRVPALAVTCRMKSREAGDAGLVASKSKIRLTFGASPLLIWLSICPITTKSALWWLDGTARSGTLSAIHASESFPSKVS